MKKASSLTPDRKQKLAHAFNQHEVKKNPDLAMQTLTDWHDTLGNSAQEQEYKDFLEMLVSPVVVRLLERNTGMKIEQMDDLISWHKNCYKISNINYILASYAKILKPDGSKDLFSEQAWCYKNMPERNASTLKNIDYSVIAHLAYGTDDSYSEAFKLQNLQMKCGEDDVKSQQRIINNMTLVANACTILATPKSYEIAKNIFKHQQDILPATSENNIKAQQHLADLEKTPINDVMDTIALFADNHIGLGFKDFHAAKNGETMTSIPSKMHNALK